MGCGFTEGAMSAGVFGEIWGWQEAVPGGVSNSIGVIVFIGALDGGDGAPEVISVFSFPAGDGGIGLGEAEEGEEAGGFGEGQVFLEADVGGDFVPVARGHGGVGEVGPEHGGLFLVGRASGAVEAAECLDFEEVGGVLLTIQRWWAWGEEWFEVFEAESFDVAPVGIERWAVEGCGAEPLAGFVTGDVGDLGG